MSGKVIVLSRVSTEQQDLTQQTEEILKSIYKDGYSQSDVVIIEDKESAIKLKEEERHGLNELKRYIETDKSIESVYVYEISRISRRQKVLFSIRDYLIENKIQLVCLKPFFRLLDKDGNMSQMSSLVFSIYSSFSESEMMIKKERMMRGLRYNKMIGKAGGGVPLFGYRVNKEKRYEIEPTEAKIIQRIFYDYNHTTKSLANIAKDLKEEGLFPKTSIDTLYSDIQNWTNNRRYLGTSSYPQIISKEEYELFLQSKLRHRTAHSINTKEVYLLKGLIYDLGVERIMIPTKCKHKERIICEYTSHNRRTSKGHSIDRNRIDPIIWEEAKHIYKKYVTNKKKLIKDLENGRTVIEKKIANIKSEVNLISQRIDKVEERLIMGHLRKSKAEEMIMNFVEEREDKERRITELVNESLFKQYQITEVTLSKDVNLEMLSLNERVELIHSVIDLISFKRIDRSLSRIHIFNKYNRRVIVYQIKSLGKENIATKIEERLMKKGEKPDPIFRMEHKIRRNYKGEICMGEK